MKDEHVTKEAKKKIDLLVKFNQDVMTSQKGSTCQSSNGKNEVWDELKGVMMDPYYAPLMAEDLSGLPKTLMYICQQDVLRDEGILYAKRLKEAGNAVELIKDMGAFHGSFGLMPKSNSSIQANSRIISFLKENL